MSDLEKVIELLKIQNRLLCSIATASINQAAGYRVDVDLAETQVRLVTANLEETNEV